MCALDLSENTNKRLNAGTWTRNGHNPYAYVLQEDAKKRRHAASKRVPKDNDLVVLTVELDELVHHLVRQTDR